MTSLASLKGINFPLNRLYLEYTNFCNMACTFCPYPYQTRKQGHLDYELLKRIVDEVVEHNITKEIEITGYGEPMMNPKWDKLSQYIIDSGVNLNITTNGLLLTEANCKKLAEMDFNYIIISLQTPDEESFKIRKTSMKFQAYVERLKKFIEILTSRGTKSHLRFRFLNTLGTKYMSFPEKVSVLNSKDEVVSSIKEWVKIIYDITGYRFDDEPVSEELRKVAKLQPTMIHVTDNITLESYLCNDFWAYGVKEQIKYPTKYARCRSMTLESCLVYWNGDVSFCCADFNNYLNIGSLEKNTLLEVFNSEQSKSLIESFRNFQVKHPYCQNCLGGKSLFLSVTKAIASSLYGSSLSEFQEITLHPTRIKQEQISESLPEEQDVA